MMKMVVAAMAAVVTCVIGGCVVEVAEATGEAGEELGIKIPECMLTGCDDYDPCTRDLCGASWPYLCTHDLAPNGTACGDGLACYFGECTAPCTSDCTCPASDPCVAYRCNGGLYCTGEPSPFGRPCADGLCDGAGNCVTPETAGCASPIYDCLIPSGEDCTIQPAPVGMPCSDGAGRCDGKGGCALCYTCDNCGA